MKCRCQAVTNDTYLTAGGCLLLLGLYLALPDKVYVFDGVIFAGVIERMGDYWRAQLFNRRHLLFNPLFLILRDALIRLGITVDGYSLIQKANAVFGVLGVGIYFRLMARLTSRCLAAVAAGMLAVSFSYWSRATEGQVYMLMTLGSIASAYGAIVLVQQPTRLAAIGLCVALILAVMFHTANAVLLPMALAAFWLAGGRWRSWWTLAVLVLGVAAPFAVVFRLAGASSVFDFFLHATEFYSPQGAGSWGGLLARFFGTGGWSQAAVACREFSASLVARSAGVGWGAVLGMLLLTALIHAWRRKPRRGVVVVLLLWWLGFVFLNVTWGGGPFFWASPLAAFLALVSFSAGDFLETATARGRRLLLAGGWFLVLCVGAWNLHAGILPQSRLENNIGYKSALFVRDNTIAQSWVITTGLGFPNSKVYLPYFAQRRREALEYYFYDKPKEEGLQLFKEFLQHQIKNGIPLYVLSDVVEDGSVQERVRAAWGVTPEDLRSCFGPGRLIRVAEQDPHLKVFLFVPQGYEESLLAVLGYGFLMETDKTRLEETARLIFEIGRGWTPERRRGFVQTMEKSDFGERFLWEGLYRDMGPEFRDQFGQEMKSFRTWRQTPAFHVRMGNIYSFLGVFDDARHEWEEAYRVTHDPAIADDIARLGKPL